MHTASIPSYSQTITVGDVLGDNSGTVPPLNAGFSSLNSDLDQGSAEEIYNTNLNAIGYGDYYQVTCRGDGSSCPEGHKDKVMWLEVNPAETSIKDKAGEQIRPELLQAYKEIRTAVESDRASETLQNNSYLGAIMNKKLQRQLAQGFKRRVIHGYVSANGDVAFYNGSLRNPTFLYVIENPRIN